MARTELAWSKLSPDIKRHMCPHHVLPHVRRAFSFALRCSFRAIGFSIPYLDAAHDSVDELLLEELER